MTAEAPAPATPVMWLARVAIILGWALILSGLGLFGWECLLWLRDGDWPRESLADLWGRSPLGGDAAVPGWEDMRGLHMILYRVIHWFGRFPIGLALVTLGVGFAWVGNGLHDRAEQALLRRRPLLRKR